jgi:adenylyl-sulfate kinase
MTGFTLWLTGLPSAGKTTLARALAQELTRRGVDSELLDGDAVRRELWPELSFSREDRDTNVRRVGYIAELLSRHGVATLVALVSPYRDVRDEQRRRIERFVEVFVDCPLEVCVARDVKGLYAAQRAGSISGVTGVDDPYEPPLSPEVVVHSSRESVEASAARVLSYLDGQGYLRP